MHAILVAVLLAIAGCAGPRPAAPPPDSYIASEHLDAARFLGPPPETRGPEQAADLAAVRAGQHLRGTPRWTLAQHDDDVSPFAAFGPVFGPAFVKASAPKTAALFDVLFADARSLTAPAKDAFGRPRPPLVDPSIETCAPLEQTKSYPSGHATRGWMMALVLSEMVPEQATAILARGRDYGDSRVVCGEHFPSDVQAGRLVGAAIFAAARTNADFARDFDQAAAEVRGLLGLPPRH